MDLIVRASLVAESNARTTGVRVHTHTHTSPCTQTSHPLYCEAQAEKQGRVLRFINTRSTEARGVCQIMAPKKDEAMLLADLRDHIQWIEDNGFMLRARTGSGLRGKVRQSGKGKEAQVYKWFSYYADRIASSFALSFAVHALDAWVNGETRTHADNAGSVMADEPICGARGFQQQCRSD